MSIKRVTTAMAMCGALTLSAGSALAQDAKSLDELLGFVKKGQVTEAKENRAREQRFAKNKANQATELKNAEAERTRQEELSAQLEDTFEENELLVAAKQKQLKEKLGTLAELFGHLTSASGDLASNMEFSLVSAQYPGREAFLEELISKMSGSDKLPSIEEIERVWYELNREMVESGKVVSFSAEVAKPNGDKVEQKVVRVGTFNVVSEEGKYLQFVASKGSLEELARQPSGPYLGLV
jgi:biopolymer transport protein ExbB